MNQDQTFDSSVALRNRVDLPHSYLVSIPDPGLGQRTCIDNVSLIRSCSLAAILMIYDRFEKPAN
jgi:hypothetical protein